MTRTTDDTLGTINAVGGLWGGPLLTALRDQPDQLPGTKPTDYDLPATLDLRDATRAAWTILTAAWADFDAHRRLRADHLQDEWYGTDNFTLPRWTHHLLDQLGYHQPDKTGAGGLLVDDGDPDDEADHYPITHLWQDRIPLHLLPAGIPLDKTTPHVPGAAKQSPHSTMQDYLNRTSGHLWGIVTNGLTLRLLRNNAALTRQAYVEFDLATMFGDDNYADFAVLWMALHATRFASDDGPSACIAEKWQQHAAETGVRALDALRGGVEAAIEQIGQGLVEHPDNRQLRDRLAAGDIDGQDLYRQLLYIAYRHVFLFAVEDRDLLHDPEADPDHVAVYRNHYSTRRLREQARRHLGGNHPDGFEIHKTVAAALASPQGEPLLALPPVLGTLWDPASTADINAATLTNRRYYAALRQLAYVQRDGVTHRVDYRNMGSDELGAVYEALLEIKATASATAWTFQLERLAGSERKTTGSYYTPSSLIARVLDDALDPVVARATEGKSGAEAAQAVLDLTVCDPAMGSAHFLTAAAHRLARHVSSHRTGQTEPPPDDYREALRDVVSRCIYGVDVNPMAVELAKTALWLECHIPGKPLTFLDHHLKWGNSLLGVGLDPSLIDWSPPQGHGDKGKGGVPDAAFKALHGDDKAAAKKLREANKARRGGAASLLASGAEHDDPTPELAEKALEIAAMDDDTPDGLADKQRAWTTYSNDEELRREKLRADAWTACWTTPKTNEQLQHDDQPFDVYYDCHYDNLPADTRPGAQTARREAADHRFFHWHIEYPDVCDAGGFSCLVGNPPWEVMQLTEEEWFSDVGRDDIAKAKSATARKSAIASLLASDDEVEQALAKRWVRAQQSTQALRVFAANSGRYPHGSGGKINLYALFADHFLAAHHHLGASGFICPDGLAVKATYSPFFEYLVSHGRLSSFWSFENEEKIFPGVHNETKFALVTFDRGKPTRRIGFTGYVRQAEQIEDPSRRYELAADEIAAINPNTLTAPLFRRSANAAVTTRIHGAAPVLILENGGTASHSPWNVEFLEMFNMTSASGLFIEPRQAEREGYRKTGNLWLHPDGRRLLPLYEGKMLWLYDHRYGTYEGQTEKQANKGVLPHTTARQKSDPTFVSQPRYWMPESAVSDVLDHRGWSREWFIGFRQVGPSERTFIPAALPRYATGNNMPLLLPDIDATRMPILLASLSSLVVDFSLRQKSSSQMNHFVVKQAPVLGPEAAEWRYPWDDELLVLGFVAPRVAELVYTADGLQGFAADIGYSGTPFHWDADRRPVLQAEIDALMFLLYGLDRDDTEWVLDSFEVLRKYEQRPPDKGGVGEFRTKRLVLERYDAMTKAVDSGTAYDTPLEPPPGDDSMRLPA